jgi:DNA-binding transcriptional LysR family regulator
MDLRHLKAFAAIAESRSFSKAARRLHLSQPPLSRHIRQLEEEVGLKLFVRTTSGVELTEEGAALLEKARAVLAEAAGFLEAARRARSQATITLRVGMARGLCEVVNRIRLNFAARCPDVVMEGTDMTSSSQYTALREKTIDVGIVRHVADDPCVQCEPLFEERFVAVVSECSPLARRKSVRLKQLASEPLLLHNREWAALSYDKILGLYAAAGVTPNVVTLEAEPGEQASMLAVASGKGVCLALRSALTRSYVRVTGVAAVPLDEPDAALQVQVAWRRNDRTRPVLEFLRSAREVFPAQRNEAESMRAVV